MYFSYYLENTLKKKNSKSYRLLEQKIHVYPSKRPILQSKFSMRINRLLLKSS
jgi:hypothetical protein